MLDHLSRSLGNSVFRIRPFYSVRELYQPIGSRFYHNNSQCPVGSMIKADERLHGVLQYRLCADCDVRNMEAGEREDAAPSSVDGPACDETPI